MKNVCIYIYILRSSIFIAESLGHKHYRTGIK